MSNVLRKMLDNSFEPQETWKVRHTKAMNDCDRFEKWLADMVERFQLLSKLDEMWNAAVAQGSVEYDEADEREIRDYYRQWLDKAESLSVGLRSYLDAAFTFPHTSAFQECLEAGRGVCMDDATFFSGDELVELRDDAIDSNRRGETVELPGAGD